MEKIITHGGPAHRDDFLACALMLAKNNIAPIERRDPTPEEMADPDILVLDVGEVLDGGRNNFDHHQLERGTRECTLSLLNQHFKLGLEVFEWFEPTVLLDSCGPVAASKEYGLGDGVLLKFLSPVERSLLKLFEQDPNAVASLLHQIGLDILFYAESVKKDLRLLEKQAQVVPLNGVQVLVCEERVTTKAVAMFREEKHPDIVMSILPDDRGDGWAIFRFDDDPRVDLSNLVGSEVVFAHKAGFLAKTRKLSVPAVLALAAGGIRKEAAHVE